MAHDRPGAGAKMLLVGRILGTFGWAGEVKVAPETDFPQHFRSLEKVTVEFADGRRSELQITAARVNARQIRLKFAEYDNKEDAAELRGAFILIPEAEATPLPDGQFYIHQIIGLSVRTADGEDLGRVTEVVRSPANDVYVTPQADIPALKQVVKTIDLEEGLMVVEAGGILRNE